MADVDEPHPAAGQVRIAVRAAGVNPIDWKVRSGALREVMALSLPVTDGREASGVIDEVGPGVTAVAPGDEVFGFAVGGAAAEYAVLDDFARKPSALSFEEAAGLPVGVETSACASSTCSEGPARVRRSSSMARPAVSAPQPSSWPSRAALA